MSVKTARRDLEALAIAGIPVYSQPGRNGGWQLLGGGRTDLSGLTENEARTLFMVAGPASTATPEAKAALRKLVQALPETFRADAELAASSMVLDPATWGTEAVRPPQFLDQLRHAVVVGPPGTPRLRRPHLRRDDPGRAPARARRQGRHLVPRRRHGQGPAHVPRQPHPHARAHRRPRRAPSRTSTSAATWRAVVDEVEAKRATVQRPGPRRAACGPCTPLPVRTFDADPRRSPAAASRRPSSDHVDVLVGAPSTWRLAADLAGWGELLEVIEPAEVREHLAMIGADLVARYGTA